MRAKVARSGIILGAMRFAFLCLLPVLTACQTMIRGEELAVGARVLQDTRVVDQGKLGVEMGFTVDPGQRKTVPIYFEYGVSDTLNVFLDLSAYEKVDQPGDDGEGIGDAGLGARTLLFDLEAGTRGLLEARMSIPTGDVGDGTGSGDVEWFAAGVLNQAFEQATFGLWLELGLLGNAFGSDPDTAQRVGANVTVGLADDVLGFLELENEYLEDLDTGVARFGVALKSSAATVMDLGVSLGLDEDAADAVYFVGFTTQLGLGYREPLPMPETLR